MCVVGRRFTFDVATAPKSSLSVGRACQSWTTPDFVVPQGLRLYTDLTMAGNLTFSAAAYGAPRPNPGDLAGDLDRLAP